MPRHKVSGGKQIPFTQAEEEARDAAEAQAAIDRQAEKDDATAAAAKKASGKQKLKDLGLDDEEIKSLMGV